MQRLKRFSYNVRLLTYLLVALVADWVCVRFATVAYNNARKIQSMQAAHQRRANLQPGEET